MNQGSLVQQPAVRGCVRQAFAEQTDAFPKDWVPLSVVAPLTEFSAELQAIAYCLESPATGLVFVDRSGDHIFQWMPQTPDALHS